MEGRRIGGGKRIGGRTGQSWSFIEGGYVTAYEEDINVETNSKRQFTGPRFTEINTLSARN